MRRLSLLFAAAVASVASPSAAQFRGVGWSHSELKAVEVAAARGDRNAQLELGKRYEAGKGVPKDLEKAKSLYRQAANRMDDVHTVYSPAVGKVLSARITSTGGRVGPRLPEAEERLAHLLKTVPMDRHSSEMEPHRDCPDCVSISLVKPEDAAVAPFYMATFETSWREYLRAVEEAGCTIPSNINGEEIRKARDLHDDYAVSGITYADAQCFIAWLSAKASHSYRLPTLNEWQSAARTASVTALDQDPHPANLVNDPRTGVRTGDVRIVMHGKPSKDGIYGLRDGVGEMLLTNEKAPDYVCKAYHQPNCLKMHFVGEIFFPDVQEPLHYTVRTESLTIVGFRVVRDVQ